MEIILKAERVIFGEMVIIAKKQTASYERCPPSSAGTTSLGAIHSK